VEKGSKRAIKGEQNGSKTICKKMNSVNAMIHISVIYNKNFNNAIYIPLSIDSE